VFDALALRTALHLGDLEQLEVVVDEFVERFVAGDLVFDVGALTEERLRLGRVVPESGGARAVVELV
jgi:hypothetical protein